MYDKNNVFAKIIRGEIPCKKIAENEHALSFHDVNPICATHALVIPKGEYENILDFVRRATAVERDAFWECFRETADALGVTANFNTLANAGTAAPMIPQSVMHFHLHLIAGNRNPECQKIFQCLAAE